MLEYACVCIKVVYVPVCVCGLLFVCTRVFVCARVFPTQLGRPLVCSQLNWEDLDHSYKRSDYSCDYITYVQVEIYVIV